MIDARKLIEAIEAAAEQAVSDSLDRMVDLAKEKAPVRKMFKGGRRRISQEAFAVQTGIALNQSRGPAYEYRNRSATRAFNLSSGRTVVFVGSRQFSYQPKEQAVRREFGGERFTERRQVDKEPASNLGGRGRGRANSYHPVVSLPGIGRVMGDFRQLSEPGKLAAATVFARVNGKTVRGDLTSMLTSGARKDIEEGRGITGADEYGGTLRDSIEKEGPITGSKEVYGFVKARAFNEAGFNYAYAQEIGTAHNAPQPYLRPAMRQLKHEFLTKSGGALRKAFETASVRQGSGVSKTISLEVEIVGFEKFERDLNVPGIPVTTVSTV